MPVAIGGEHLPTEVMRRTSTQMSIPETVYDSMCKNDLVVQTHQLSGWLVSDDPTGEEAACGVVTHDLWL